MQDNVPSLDERSGQPLQVADRDGKIYERLETGQVRRLSPKLTGKDRRLARQMAKMMNKEN